jgi:corrinoid protein of di/trimethylamine methyltransferase
VSDDGILNGIAKAVEELDSDKAVELVQQALDQGIDPLKIINDGIVSGLNLVSAQYDEGNYFLAELTMAGQMSKELIGLVVPHLPEGETATRKTVVIGTVQGDMHDIGKNLVALMLSCHGYNVIDLGKNVPAMEFVRKVREAKPNVVGLSSLMVTTLPNQAEVINYLKELGLRDKVKVIVGGGPTTQDYADSLGADGWAPDAAKAVRLVDNLVEIRR